MTVEVPTVEEHDALADGVNIHTNRLNQHGTQLKDIAAAISKHGERLGKLETLAKQNQSRSMNNVKRLDEAEARLDALDQTVEGHDLDLNDIEARLTTLESGGSEPAPEPEPNPRPAPTTRENGWARLGVNITPPKFWGSVQCFTNVMRQVGQGGALEGSDKWRAYFDLPSGHWPHPGSLRYQAISMPPGASWHVDNGLLISGVPDPSAAVLLHPGESTGSVWHSKLVGLCGKFQVLRFMDLMDTNSGSPEPQASVAEMVNLATLCNSDMWINLHWSWSDDTIRAVIAGIAKNLPAHLHCYVELGNEIWNGSFGSQEQYFLYLAGVPDRQKVNGVDNNRTYLEAWGKELARVFQIVANAAGETASNARFSTVVGGKENSAWMNEQVLKAALDAGYRPNVLATTAYFGNQVRDNTLTDDQVFAAADADLEERKSHRRANRKLADEYGLVYAMYEAGQHVKVKRASIHRDPRMGALIQENIDDALQIADGPVCIHTLCKPVAGRGNDFGYLEHMESGADQSVKWQGLVAAADAFGGA